MNKLGTYKTISYINDKKVINKCNILSDKVNFYLEDKKTRCKMQLDASTLQDIIVNCETSIRKIKKTKDGVKYTLKLKHKDITVKIRTQGETLNEVSQKVGVLLQDISIKNNKESLKTHILS